MAHGSGEGVGLPRHGRYAPHYSPRKIRRAIRRARPARKVFFHGHYRPHHRSHPRYGVGRVVAKAARQEQRKQKRIAHARKVRRAQRHELASREAAFRALAPIGSVTPLGTFMRQSQRLRDKQSRALSKQIGIKPLGGRTVTHDEHLPDFKLPPSFKNTRPSFQKGEKKYLRRQQPFERKAAKLLAQHPKHRSFLQSFADELLGKTYHPEDDLGASRHFDPLKTGRYKPEHDLGHLKLPLGVDVRAELEGRGKFAKVSKKLGEIASRGVDQPGSTQQAGLVPLSSKIQTAAIKDVFNAPSAAVSSAYVPLAGVKESLQGRPQRLREFKKQLRQHDPIALSLQGKFGSAAKEFKRHPVLTGLEVAGVGRGLSRGAGRLIPREARTPRTIHGTALKQRRTYPLGVVGRVAAKGNDRRLIRKASKLEDRGRFRSAAKAHPHQMQETEIRRRVDERFQLNENKRRAHRAPVIKQAKKLTAKHGAPAQVLATQNIVKLHPDDLKAYHAELLHQYDHGNLGDAEKLANRSTRKHIRSVLNDPKVDYAKLSKATGQYAAFVKPLQQELVKRNLIAPEQAARAPLVGYAVRHMGARHDKENGLVRDVRVPGSKTKLPAKISNEQIKAHMRQQGFNPERATYVTHAPNQRGAKNYFFSADKPASVHTGTRTGEAARKGTFDIHPDVLKEGPVRMQGLIDQDQNFKDMIGEFALRENKEGRSQPLTRKSRKDIQKVIDNYAAKHPAAHELTPVRVNPWGGDQEQLQSLLDDTSLHPAEHKSVIDALDSALQGSGPGPWTAIPRAAADQASQHVRSLGPGAGAKTARMARSQFSKTVLSTSTKWLTGNTVEGGGRTAVMGATPAHHTLMGKLLDRLKEEEPQAHEDVMNRAFAGAHFGATARQDVYTSAEGFRGTHLEGPARAAALLRRARGPKQVLDAWSKYTNAVFRSNAWVEAQFQKTMGGKFVASELMPHGLMDLSEKAMQEAVQGLRETHNQIALARAVDRAYGKYEGFSPQKRLFITQYAPFFAWGINALRFLGDVLPRDHPVLTAAIAASEVATEDYRKHLGLAKGYKHSIAPWQQGSIPIGKMQYYTTKSGKRYPKGKKLLPVSRYLPFGAFSDPGGYVAQSFIPQISGSLDALQGRDWTGKPLKGRSPDEATDQDKAKAALMSLVEGFVPVYGQASRGTKGLNPFRPIKPFDPSVTGKIEDYKAVKKFFKGKKKHHHRKRGSGNLLGGSSRGGGNLLGP